MDNRYDVVVAGARCAGAATAMLLAAAGARVLVVDRARAGADTLSTHALMRGGVLLLARWGLVPELLAGGAPPYRATTFHYAGERVEVAIKPRHGVDALLAPRRTLLDPILAGAARRAGAEVRHGATVRALLRDRGGRVTGVALEEGGGVREIAAGLVVGADGVRSTVAGLVAAPVTRAAAHASAIVYGYWRGLDLGSRWLYRPGVAAGTIPTDGDLSCVFVGAPPARVREALRGDVAAGTASLLAAASPELGPALAVATRVGALRRFGGQTGFLRRAHGPGWALVGDAGSFKDPLTAHGITDALRDAAALARAVLRGGPAALAAYEAERDAASIELLEISDRIASFAWDLDEVRGLHQRLSEVLSREVAALVASGYSPSAGSSSSVITKSLA